MKSISHHDCEYNPAQVTLVSNIKSRTEFKRGLPYFANKATENDVIYLYNFYVELSSGTEVTYEHRDKEDAEVQRAFILRAVAEQLRPNSLPLNRLLTN